MVVTPSAPVLSEAMVRVLFAQEVVVVMFCSSRSALKVVSSSVPKVIAGAEAHAAPALTAEQIVQELKKRIGTQGLSRKDAVKAVAQEYGLAKNIVYQYSLKKENENS